MTTNSFMHSLCSVSRMATAPSSSSTAGMMRAVRSDLAGCLLSMGRTLPPPPAMLSPWDPPCRRPGRVETVGEEPVYYPGHVSGAVVRWRSR